jgi:hypothetical protein
MRYRLYTSGIKFSEYTKHSCNKSSALITNGGLQFAKSAVRGVYIFRLWRSYPCTEITKSATPPSPNHPTNPQTIHFFGASNWVTPTVVNRFLCCLANLLCREADSFGVVSNRNLQNTLCTMTYTGVTSIIATYQQRIAAKPYVPATT